MRVLIHHLVVLCLLFTLSSLQVAVAQCSDMDGDGYGRPGDATCPSGSDEDCNDRDPATYPGAPERCEGYDNNCSGFIDDDPACDNACSIFVREGADVQVSVDPGSRYPSSTWTGSEFGVVWRILISQANHRSGTYFARLDARGRRIGSPIHFTTSWAHSSDIVWTGSEYGVVWNYYGDGMNGYEIFFARLDKEGRKIGTDVRITYADRDSDNPSIAWSGKEYGIAWGDERHEPGMDGRELYFVRVDAEGNKIGDETRLTVGSRDSIGPDLVWNGAGWAIVWNENGSVDEDYFIRLSPEGIPLDVAAPFTTVDRPGFPHVVWTGREYGTVFRDYNTTPNLGDYVHLQRLDDTGSSVGEVNTVSDLDTDAKDLSLAWTGTEYGVAWTDARLLQWDIYLARVDATGDKIGSDLAITSIPARSERPGLSWAGAQYGVIWEDERGGGSGEEQIYLARIRCSCTDNDLDDNCSDIDCDDGDGTVWAPPDGVRDLLFDLDSETMTWTEPSDPGAPLPDLLYDTIRSEDASDFGGTALCLETNGGPDTTVSDPETPTPGSAFFYLVRAETSCPEGQGMLGPGEGGFERTARACD
jgi:hypothetical protein